jgi:hypothetical protein
VFAVGTGREDVCTYFISMEIKNALHNKAVLSGGRGDTHVRARLFQQHPDAGFRYPSASWRPYLHTFSFLLPYRFEVPRSASASDVCWKQPKQMCMYWVPHVQATPSLVSVVVVVDCILIASTSRQFYRFISSTTVSIVCCSFQSTVTPASITSVFSLLF